VVPDRFSDFSFELQIGQHFSAPTQDQTYHEEANVKTRSIVGTIVATIFVLVFTAAVWAQVTPRATFTFPIMSTGSNTSLYYQEITTTPQNVISFAFNKVAGSSLSVLRVSFSGGFFSFWLDANGKAPQALIEIMVDGIPQALTVDYASGTYRNSSPTLSTVVSGISTGSHVVTVTVSKTADEGYLTYTTETGQTPDTCQAVLTVEEWFGS
jgi:uncharacterized membrane protein